MEGQEEWGGEVSWQGAWRGWREGDAEIGDMKCSDAEEWDTWKDVSWWSMFGRALTRRGLTAK